jgi:hypothetical protein
MMVPEFHRADARQALPWLAFAKQPMNLGEISEAIIVDTDSKTFDPRERLFDMHGILDICSSFVSLSEPFPGAQDHQRLIHLAHYSVKEYLCSKQKNVGWLSESSGLPRVLTCSWLKHAWSTCFLSTTRILLSTLCSTMSLTYNSLS